MPGHRIFVAVDISNAARDRAAVHISDLRREFSNSGVGWERPEKLHITLKFLGDTDDGTLSQLVGRLEDCGRNHAPMDLRLARPGVFPTRSNARVLWIGIDGESDRLAAIHRDVETECDELGFERDKRRFKPHLTIGRVRRGAADPALIDRHFTAQIEPVEFRVTAIAVYESVLRPTGSVYSVIARAGLGSA